MSIQTLSLRSLKIEINDKNNIGTLIGISNLRNKTWMCCLMLDSDKMAVLYDGSKPKSVIESNFEQLSSSRNLDENGLLKLNFANVVKLDDFQSNQNDLEFFIYNMNIFSLSKMKNLTTSKLISVIKYNFDVLSQLDESDVVKCDRGAYSHHAILTDKVRMIVTHRWGEPEDGGQFYICSQSIIGIPTGKACVSEDHLIEVAGYRTISNGNNDYDKYEKPRSKAEILAEAKRRVGEVGYSLTTGNCQHLVSECRNGTSQSPEVNGVKNGAAVAGGALLAAGAITAITLGLSALFSDKEKKKEVKNINY